MEWEQWEQCGNTCGNRVYVDIIRFFGSVPTFPPLAQFLKRRSVHTHFRAISLDGSKMCVCQLPNRAVLFFVGTVGTWEHMHFIPGGYARRTRLSTAACVPTGVPILFPLRQEAAL